MWEEQGLISFIIHVEKLKSQEVSKVRNKKDSYREGSFKPPDFQTFGACKPKYKPLIIKSIILAMKQYDIYQ
jgi:hypothetical protein